MLRDEMMAVLREFPTGLSTSGMLGRLNMDLHSKSAAVVEALLLLAPEVSSVQGTWRLAKKGRDGTILDAIEIYAVDTGRRIFRASAALERIPLHERPSEEELRRTIEQSGGRYELLPNQMIRRNG